MNLEIKKNIRKIINFLNKYDWIDASKWYKDKLKKLENKKINSKSYFETVNLIKMSIPKLFLDLPISNIKHKISDNKYFEISKEKKKLSNNLYDSIIKFEKRKKQK